MGALAFALAKGLELEGGPTGRLSTDNPAWLEVNASAQVLLAIFWGRGKDCLLLPVSGVCVCESMSLRGVENTGWSLWHSSRPWELCLHEVPLAA